jgi:hypothetical protein
MYDTLLQMGRWFGYRDGFSDLCRLFIKPEALDWYAYIAEATEELREEIRKMESVGLTPMDFGLAVRSHPGSLLVTARNKMRTAEEIVREVGLAGRLVESAAIHAAEAPASANWKRAAGLVERLVRSGAVRLPHPKGSRRSEPSQLFKDVPQELIMDFISGFALHPGNPEMSAGPMIEYSRARGFDTWQPLGTGPVPFGGCPDPYPGTAGWGLRLADPGPDGRAVPGDGEDHQRTLAEHLRRGRS